jgi:predicted enzyme related to lactoylglutathione lyase
LAVPEITGAHAIIFVKEPDRVRAFCRDVLELRSVDAGDGWLIFALPPAELGIHPTDAQTHNGLYLMCDDIQAVVDALRSKGATIVRPIADEGWGLLTALELPGGGELGLYQPRHPSPLQADS